MSQSRRLSLLEAVTNVTVGYVLAVATQIVVFPDRHIPDPELRVAEAVRVHRRRKQKRTSRSWSLVEVFAVGRPQKRQVTWQIT